MLVGRGDKEWGTIFTSPKNMCGQNPVWKEYTKMTLKMRSRSHNHCQCQFSDIRYRAVNCAQVLELYKCARKKALNSYLFTLMLANVVFFS